MGVAEALGRGVERLGSGRAALAYWRALLATSPAPSAFRAALRLALVHDRAAVAELVPLWATIPVTGSAPELVDACRDLARAGMRADAEALAALEVTRARTAKALYLWARCSTGTDATERFAETIVRATSEGAGAIVASARRRRAELLAARWDTLPEAVVEASAIDLAVAGPGERLAIARVLLLASSRFVRATAIGILDELVTTERADRTLAPAALHAAARFADDAAFALTPLEVERLRALFGRPYALAHAPGAAAVLVVREPGANDALVLSLARAGWELAASDRAAALAKLREARQFASAVPIRK